MNIVCEELVEIPDSVKMCGERCNIEKTEDGYHYYCHPTEDMKDDIDLHVSPKGNIITGYIGDVHWLEWIIPCPSKFLKSQIRSAARRLGERR